jgi:hypothetical protein
MRKANAHGGGEEEYRALELLYLVRLGAREERDHGPVPPRAARAARAMDVRLVILGGLALHDKIHSGDVQT